MNGTMVESLSDIRPRDDSGADVFARFRYQAHVAFRFCLNCYFEQGVLAVIPEHFEDLLVEASDKLRFVQVKTRNVERGPWQLRHLIDDAGALRSLLRTHRALAGFDDGRQVIYDIRLEGALKRNDPICRLAPSGGGADDSIRQICARRLGCDDVEVTGLLTRVVVHALEPPRELIEGRNLNDLRRVAGHLPANDLKRAYDDAISLIEQAMRAELLNDAWPRAILDPPSATEAARQRVKAKRIDRLRLAKVLGKLDGSDRALLGPITDVDSLRATDLERKMIAARAPKPLIEQAKQMRAQAIRHLIEFRTSRMLAPEPRLADLEFRLLAVAQTSTAAAGAGVSVAEIWRAIEARLESHAAEYDPRHILKQEPLLLMGALCQYSDQCKFAWTADA